MRSETCVRTLSRPLREIDRMITAETIKAIEAILKRGNDVQIKRKGDGYIVLEVIKRIAYRSSG